MGQIAPVIQVVPFYGTLCLDLLSLLSRSWLFQVGVAEARGSTAIVIVFNSVTLVFIILLSLIADAFIKTPRTSSKGRFRRIVNQVHPSSGVDSEPDPYFPTPLEGGHSSQSSQRWFFNEPPPKFDKPDKPIGSKVRVNAEPAAKKTTPAKVSEFEKIYNGISYHYMRIFHGHMLCADEVH